MQNFVRGQRAKLSQFCSSTSFEVRIAVQSGRVPVFDFVCFGVDAREQLADDRYMVFFNQKSAPGGAITLDKLSDTDAAFKVDLSALPPEIDRLVFTVSVDGVGVMKDLNSGAFSLLDAASAQPVLEYRFAGADFDSEGALMLAAIYRKDGEWRIWAQGQGFAGNLNALLKHFGGVETEDAQNQADQTGNNGAGGTVTSNQHGHQTPTTGASAGGPSTQPSPPVSAPATASMPVVLPPMAAGNSLQQLVAQALPGSTITLPRGEHPGPLFVDKPLTIEGAGAVIWAQNGPVVMVQSIGVTLRDVEIEATAPDEGVPDAKVALWVAPGIGTQLHNVRARGEIVGVASAEGEWKLPPYLNLGEFAPRAENSFSIEIETPHPCEIKSSVMGVALHPTQLQSGRQDVEIRVQNVAADTLLAGALELSTGGISRTIPLSGRTAGAPRAAVLNQRLWTVDGSA
jgi:stress response protein SCP2